MGTKEGMGYQHKQITLYTAQTGEVVGRLMEHGRHYVEMEYIIRKYAEVSDVFVQAYLWYNENAERILPKPAQAESAIWTFCGSEYLERHPGSQILKLSVPIENAVFFRMRDWNKILNLCYIGESEEDEAKFAEKLNHFGVHDEIDAYTAPFYPHLKKEIRNSWERLFRYDRKMKDTGVPLYPDMQAGLWFLSRQWIQQIYT